MKTPRLNIWTEERVDALRKLWGEDRACSEIGLMLGLTKNSVIGKARRLGLQRHDSATRRVNHRRAMALNPRPAPKPPAAPRRYVHNPIGNIPQKLETRKREKAKLAVGDNGQVFERVADQPLPLTPREQPGLATIETLGVHMCKWPIGETRDPGFTYCGRLTDSTYCRVHAAIAFAPLKPRQPRNGNELCRSLRRFL